MQAAPRPWLEPRTRRASRSDRAARACWTRDARFAQMARIGLAFVAQRIVFGGEHECGRNARQGAGEPEVPHKGAPPSRASRDTMPAVRPWTADGAGISLADRTGRHDGIEHRRNQNLTGQCGPLVARHQRKAQPRGCRRIPHLRRRPTTPARPLRTTALQAPRTSNIASSASGNRCAGASGYRPIRRPRRPARSASGSRWPVSSEPPVKAPP